MSYLRSALGLLRSYVFGLVVGTVLALPVVGVASEEASRKGSVLVLPLFVLILALLFSLRQPIRIHPLVLCFTASMAAAMAATALKQGVGDALLLPALTAAAAIF